MHSFFFLGLDVAFLIVFLWSCALNPNKLVYNQLKVFQLHHGYFGDAIVILSLLFLQHALFIIFSNIGLILRIDDTEGHLAQSFARKPLYSSPLKTIFYFRIAPKLLFINKRLTTWLEERIATVAR